MKICGDGESETNSDHPPKLNAVVRRYTTKHVVGDSLVFGDNESTGGSNNETN